MGFPVLVLGQATNAAVGSVGGALLASVWAGLLSLVARFVIGNNRNQALLYVGAGLLGGFTGFVVTFPFVYSHTVLQPPSNPSLDMQSWQGYRVLMLVGIAIAGGQLAGHLGARKTLLREKSEPPISLDAFLDGLDQRTIVRLLVATPLLVLLVKFLYPGGPGFLFILICLLAQIVLSVAALLWEGRTSKPL